LHPGARIAIAMPNQPEFIEVMWAAWFAGLTIVPINARLHASEMNFILRHSGSLVCFATADIAHALSTCDDAAHPNCRIISVHDSEFKRLATFAPMAPVDVASSAPAWIFYTSGTTGKPKGAVLSHGALYGMTWRYYADVDHLGIRDTFLHTSALSHGGGLYSIPHTAKGSHHVIPTVAIGSSLAGTFDLIDRYANVSFVVSPTLLLQLADHPAASKAQPHRIKTILYGSAPISLIDLRQALSTFGPCLWQGYGQGETPGTLTHLDKAAHTDAGNQLVANRLQTVGVARTGVQVRVVRPDGSGADVDEPGEVICRSDVTMSGYWNDPHASAETLRGGWLHTGDAGCFDRHGFLTLKDRLKDVIITEGMNVYPREVEDVLRQNALVSDVAVVGQTDTVLGEQIVAFLVAQSKNERPSDEELRVLCRSRIANYKCPTRFVWLSELPRNTTCKIMKTVLRKTTQ
jgi:long-chain acyl-CoA synthetase